MQSISFTSPPFTVLTLVLLEWLDAERIARAHFSLCFKSCAGVGMERAHTVPLQCKLHNEQYGCVTECCIRNFLAG